MRKLHKSFLERDRDFDDEFQNRRFCNVAAAAVMVVGTYVAADQASSSAESAANAQAQGMSAQAASTAEAAKIQQQTAREYLDFQKQQYADMKPLAEAVSQAQLDTMKQQSTIAASNEARAQDYANYEKNTFRPLEQSLVDDANSYNTDAKQEELARKGMADVSQAYDAQRKQALDTLARYGVNPNSNRFAALNMQLAQGEAADKAGAATNARTNAEQLGYARKMDAASLGRNLASNSSTAYGIATSAGNSSVNSGSAALSTAGAPGAALGSAYGSFSSQMGNAANSYYGAGNLYGTGYKIAAGQQAAADSALSGLTNMGVRAAIGYGVTGTGAGAANGAMGAKVFADGGKVHRGGGAVRGPGGPVDDVIDAKLSNGEYVLPADTVRAIGVNKLNKVVAKTHTPAAVQRRSALKGA
jgi:hypothetical protein